MDTKTCPHCNEVALRNPDADFANHSDLEDHDPIMYYCWKCTECYDVFWLREEGVAV